jgi:Mlc titration factor MtfA (ptsG expression regulator)
VPASADALLDAAWLVARFAAGVGVGVAAYFLVPRLGRMVHLLPFRPRVRYRKEPIPTHWREIVARNVPLAARLAASDREHLLRLAQVFLHDKPMEGVGLALTDEIRVTIAAQACLLLLHLDYPCYPTLRRVLVYPGVFHPRRVDVPRLGEIHEEPRATLGEAWTSGVVVLSWDSSLVGALNPDAGQNVVLHEFAHVLDGENGAMDGLPLLDHPSSFHTWSDVFQSLYERQVRETLEGKEPPVHPYGATNRAEFFAVATEAFFTSPGRLRERLPELYGELAKFYRQDPAVLEGAGAVREPGDLGAPQGAARSPGAPGDGGHVGFSA